MIPETKRWWKGSFPSWIVAVLLALVAWFSKQTFEAIRQDISHIRQKVDDHAPKIAALEATSAATRDDIRDIKMSLNARPRLQQNPTGTGR